MVFGGKDSTKVEVLNLTNGDSSSCIKGDMISSLLGMAGAYIGETVIACSGAMAEYVANECWVYDPVADAWRVASFELTYEASFSSSMELPNGTWLVLGGSSDPTRTNMLESWQFKEGPAVPLDVYRACAVQLDDNELFVAGGGRGSDKVFILDVDAWKITWEGTMKMKRTLAACGLVNGDKVVVTGGNAVNKSTEILDLTTKEWAKGPDFPFPVGGAGYAQFGNATFVVIGGYNEDAKEPTKGIYKFDEVDHTGWTKLPQELTTVRYAMSVMPIPNDIKLCN